MGIKNVKTASAAALLVILTVIMPAFRADASTRPANDAEAAWIQLAPYLNRFWRDLEDSPALVKRSAWPAINALKFYIQYYPDSPHIPEAYYILGEAYSSISYSTEAAAHWKTVVKYYPASKWAGSALTALVHQLKLKGNRQKILKFYKKILGQFPDSAAARMAMVLLAEDALRQGKIKMARLTAERLGRNPSIELQVPEYLRLKAMLAGHDGNYEEQRRYLLHYINLVRSRPLRASALFSIAESYRREGRLLNARKYYAFIRRDFKSEPEALYARFRLAQLEDQARGRLSRYIGTGLPPENLPATARLYARILREYPDHPLTQEVQLELLRLRIRQGRYLDAVKLGNDFLKRYPNSAYYAAAEKDTLKAVDLLEKHTRTVASLRDAVEFGLPYLKRENLGKAAKRTAQASRALWIKLIQLLVTNRHYKDALSQYRHFARVLKGDPELAAGGRVRDMAARAVAGLDRQFLSGKAFTALVNYHFAYRPMMEDVAPASHWVSLARAWVSMSCPEAALRAYFQAWQRGLPAEQRCSTLSAWTDCALENREIVTASSVIALMDANCPDQALAAEMLARKARLQAMKGRWTEAVILYRDAVRNGGGIDARVGLLDASVMTGDWSTARRLRQRIWGSVPVDERERILRKWVDEALKLHQYGEAGEACQRLLVLAPEDPSVAWRLARIREFSGQADNAIDQYKALSQAESPLWASAAAAALKNREFWDNVPEDLR